MNGMMGMGPGPPQKGGDPRQRLMQMMMQQRQGGDGGFDGDDRNLPHRGGSGGRHFEQPQEQNDPLAKLRAMLEQMQGGGQQAGADPMQLIQALMRMKMQGGMGQPSQGSVRPSRME